MPSDPAIGWCHDPARVAEAVGFFVENVDPKYISHGEMQGGRAVSPTAWSPALPEKIGREIAAMIAPAPDESSRSRALALAQYGGEIAALAMVGFVRQPSSYAVLDDLIVGRNRRGLGLGEKMLHWIEQECRARGVERLFLESGVGNGAAHRFFERQNFTVTSHVMMKELGASRQ